jgi:hypothetical protein
VSEYRNREEVMDLMLRVRTLEECERARELAVRWIEEHPADQDYILLAGEHLERVRQALLEKEEEGGGNNEEGSGVSEEDALRQAREELAQLEAQRVQLSGEVMEGRPGALEEDERLRARIVELGNWLLEAEKEGGQEGGGAA